jgi:hypothetical protein
MSFLLFECMVALGVLLSLAELVSWWAVAALPAAVASMVKLNDLVTGALSRDARTARAVPALPARYADAGQYGSPDDVTPAFGMPGGAGAAPGYPQRAGTRSSRVYGSGALASGAAAGQARVGAGEAAAATRASQGNRRFDETTVSLGSERRAPDGNRSAGRADTGRTDTGRRRQGGGDPGADRGVVDRPEWRQTVTLGRHVRRGDSRAGNGRHVGADHDAGDGRHPSGQSNRHRFA